MITSWAWLSRRPAAVMRTNRAFFTSSGRLAAPARTMPERTPPVSCVRSVETGPLWGTMPSMPSGTSFRGSSSSWKYRSAEPSFIAPSEPMPRYALNVRPWYRIVSPGASSVPAKRLPIITECAPAASAFVTSPENLMPPSATREMFDFAAPLTHSWIAWIWGTPAPVTTRVVQMEPGPMPIFTASAPRRTRSRVPSAVATLPARTGTDGNFFFRDESASSTPSLWPCEESSTRRSTFAATSSRARSRRSVVAPTAAATRRRPNESLHALGYLICFWMSLTVMRPLRLPARSTTSSFSMRWRWRSSFACSSVVPGGHVTRFSFVMRSEIGRSMRVSKRRSRFVRMPTSLPRSSTTGTPEIRKFAMTSSASEILWVGRQVTGSTIIPLSERFTLSTSAACESIVRVLWMTPSPPFCAIAIARRDSVTVSLAAERMGMFSPIPGASRVFRSVSAGWTFERAGRRRTSSNVRASGISRSFTMGIHTTDGGWPLSSAPSAGGSARPGRSVAFLVLPPGAARARVVPTNLRARGLHRGHVEIASRRRVEGTLQLEVLFLLAALLELGGGPARGGRPRGRGWGGRRAGVERIRRRRTFLARRALGRGLGDLEAEEVLEDLLLDAFLHRLEKLEGLPFVLDERVALTVAAQADAFLQMVEREEVILPERVDRLEHEELLEVAQRLRADGLLFRLVRLVHGRAQLVLELRVRVARAEPFFGRLEPVRVEGESFEGVPGPFGRVLAGGAVAVDVIFRDVFRESHDVIARQRPGEDFLAEPVDLRALLVHHVVVFEEVLARVEVAALDLRLRPLDGLRHPAVLDGDALLHAEALHEPRQAVGPEDAHEVVLEREVEARGAGVALAGFVAFRADDVEAAELDDLLVRLGRVFLKLGRDPLDLFGALVLRLLLREVLRVAAEADVRAAARHVRRDRHGGDLAGLRDDRGLLLVVLRVQDDVRHLFLLEHGREKLGLLDRDRADENGLALLALLGDLLDDGLE